MRESTVVRRRANDAPGLRPFVGRARRATGPLIVAFLLLTGGCGGESEGTRADASTETPSTTDSARQDPIQVRYVLEPGPGAEGEVGRLEMVVTTDGAERVRLITVMYADAEFGGEREVHIYDGERLLVHSKWNASPYRLYEAPEEHPDIFAGIRFAVLDPDSEQFDEVCPRARPLGAKTILGRPALGYSCGPAPEGMGGPPALWLDEATGVMLKAGVFQASKVITNPRVDEKTFSTEPPDGAEVDVIAATSGPGDAAPDFTLQMLDGGSVGLADFRDSSGSRGPPLARFGGFCPVVTDDLVPAAGSG